MGQIEIHFLYLFAVPRLGMAVVGVVNIFVEMHIVSSIIFKSRPNAHSLNNLNTYLRLFSDSLIRFRSI